MYDSKDTELSKYLPPFVTLFLPTMTKNNNNSPMGSLFKLLHTENLFRIKAGEGRPKGRPEAFIPMVKPKRIHEENTVCFSS